MGDFHLMAVDLLIARLFLAAALGALVGLERERHERPAGLRTHLLVSMGSCLFTAISVAVAGTANDPGRVAAGVITGIGFLGAGTIIRHGGSVSGLTTAASIWSVAGVGMAAGIGWWEAALAGTFLMYVSLAGLKALEGRLHTEKETLLLQVEIRRAERSLAQLHADLKALGYEPVERRFSVRDSGETGIVEVDLSDISRERAAEAIDRIAQLPGVASVTSL